jgi:hypothetical protein
MRRICNSFSKQLFKPHSKLVTRFCWSGWPRTSPPFLGHSNCEYNRQPLSTYARCSYSAHTWFQSSRSTSYAVVDKPDLRHPGIVTERVPHSWDTATVSIIDNLRVHTQSAHTWFQSSWSTSYAVVDKPALNHPGIVTESVVVGQTPTYLANPRQDILDLRNYAIELETRNKLLEAQYNTILYYSSFYRGLMSNEVSQTCVPCSPRSYTTFQPRRKCPYFWFSPVFGSF